jgi:hypothetical protein
MPIGDRVRARTTSHCCAYHRPIAELVCLADVVGQKIVMGLVGNLSFPSVGHPIRKLISSRLGRTVGKEFEFRKLRARRCLTCGVRCWRAGSHRRRAAT